MDISQLLFFNNNYDESIIQNKLVDFRESTFFQSLNLQKSVPNCKIITGGMSEFKYDKLYNIDNNLPYRAYTLSIPECIIPSQKHNQILHKYKNKVLSQLDFMKSTLVSRTITFQIDKYFFFLLNFKFDIDKTTLILYADTKEGLSEEFIKKAISENYQWTLSITPQVEFMSTYRIKTSLFTDNMVPVSLFENYYSIGKPEATDTWNMFLSCDSSDTNLLMSAEAYYNKDKKAFVVDSRFKNFIFSKISNCHCYMLNSYQRLQYTVINTLSKAKQQITITNPLHPNNINIWKYDNLNMVKLNRVTEVPKLIYPNIYDFEEIYRKYGTIYVEYCYSPLTQTHFDNNFELYQNYNSNFINDMNNGTLPEKIASYSPIEYLDLSYEEYREKGYTSVQKYRLDKLIELLKDNPLRYKKLYKEISALNRNSIIFSFTINEYQSVWERELMNTDDFKPYLDIIFEEPHTFIEFNNSLAKDRSAILFIDGRRVSISKYITIGRTLYVFFPVSFLNEDSNVTIEISNAPSISHLDTNITFESISDIQEFPVTSEKVSGLHLGFALQENSIFISNSSVQYYYNAYKYVSDEGDVLELDHKLEYYATSDIEAYAPLEASMYVLADEYAQISASGNFAKYVNSENLKISLLDSSLVGKELIVYNADKYKNLFDGEIELENTFEIKLFKGEKNHSRIRVYVDGILLKRSQYTFEFPSYYRGTIKVTIHSLPEECTNMHCIIDYLPYLDSQIFNGIPSEYHYKNGVFFLSSITNRPIVLQKLKIYVNGKRVSMNNIKELPINDGIVIFDYNKGDTIQIFIDDDDDDCYSYEDSKDNMIITDTVYNDKDFIEKIK